MRWILTVLILLFLALQYRLWFGEGSVAQKVELERAVQEQQAVIDQAQSRNDVIAREVDALKQGTDAVEERARNDLGMVKEGETFYMVIDESDDQAQSEPSQ